MTPVASMFSIPPTQTPPIPATPTNSTEDSYLKRRAKPINTQDLLRTSPTTINDMLDRLTNLKNKYLKRLGDIQDKEKEMTSKECVLTASIEMLLLSPTEDQIAEKLITQFDKLKQIIIKDMHSTTGTALKIHQTLLPIISLIVSSTDVPRWVLNKLLSPMAAIIVWSKSKKTAADEEEYRIGLNYEFKKTITSPKKPKLVVDTDF